MNRSDVFILAKDENREVGEEVLSINMYNVHILLSNLTPNEKDLLRAGLFLSLGTVAGRESRNDVSGSTCESYRRVLMNEVNQKLATCLACHHVERAAKDVDYIDPHILMWYVLFRNCT